MGQGEKSIIIWVMHGHKDAEIWLLNADREPSGEKIFNFRRRLQKMEWPGYDSGVDTDHEAWYDAEEESME